MSSQVLVLNRLWQAVNFVSAERAFGMLSQDNAQVLHMLDDELSLFALSDWLEHACGNEKLNHYRKMRTVNFAIPIPKILLLRHYDKLPTKDIKFSRENIFSRDLYTCQYCGERSEAKELNLDHIIPRGKGGQTSWENIVTSCIACNTKKADYLPHQIGMKLLRRPCEPKHRPYIMTIVPEKADKAWAPFIFSRSA